MTTNQATIRIILNGQDHELADGSTVADMIAALRLRPEHVAVECNKALISRKVHSETRLSQGDEVEVVTLVGGGAPTGNGEDLIPPLKIGTHTLTNRLMVGTGKYATLELMQECLEASGAEVITVAVRRERLSDKSGRNILDFIDLKKHTILPNTAGCYTAEEALRTARLGRELLEGLGNAGADWVKLEVLSDPRTLLPDPMATVLATEVLVKEGFQVLCYTSDCPVTARRLKAVGAACVMPAGSPIGSGQGVLNPSSIRIILEDLKGEDPDYPVVIDAGVGTASDVAFAMELGCDGVLLNTGIASAQDPLRMAFAMRHAMTAGYLAARSGRIPRKLYATASSPLDGLIR